MESAMGAVMIGVDPHKLSNTIVVIDDEERVLEEHRFANDRDGYRALKSAARSYRDRTWAVEGAKGVGLSLAQRLVAEGEPVVNVPAKLAARVRAFGGGSGRKTDSADAHAVALAGLRAMNLTVVTPDDVTTVLRLLTDRQQQLIEQRIATLNRLHDLLQTLIPGGAKPGLSAGKAKELLSSVRPRGQVGKARKQIAGEYLTEFVTVDTKLKDVKKQIGAVLDEHPTSLVEVRGVGNLIAADQASLRQLNRHRTHRRIVGRQQPAPAQPRRQPSPQPRPAHHRDLPDPLPLRRAGLLPAQARRRQVTTRSHPVPQTPALRRRLPAPHPGPRTARSGPGRTLGGGSSIQRG
jgi:transposase